LKKAIAEKGADTPVAFPNTAYFLPVTYGMLSHKVETLADLEYPLNHAKTLLHPLPAENLWVPYLGETLDSGIATLLAAEAIEKGADVFNPRGQAFTKENIRQRLAMRNFMEEMRNAGQVTGGPAPFSQTDRKEFADKLDRWLQQNASR